MLDAELMSLPDLASAPAADLHPPVVEEGEPQVGRRVYVQLPGWPGGELRASLYLPPTWSRSAHLPVVIEYAGNGPYHGPAGDFSSGRHEDAVLGFGATGGDGFIWLTLPFVEQGIRGQATQWWGDAAASAAMLRDAARYVCDRWGGDARRRVLAGFSRGSIACNFIGLRDVSTAALWRAFICHSHYDGVKPWPYVGSDRRSAISRLQRLHGRPQFVSHEGAMGSATQPARELIDEARSTGAAGDITYVDLPYRNHTAAWTLRPIPQREQLRAWLQRVIT